MHDGVQWRGKSILELISGDGHVIEVVVVSDEWGGGIRGECAASTWGPICILPLFVTGAYPVS